MILGHQRTPQYILELQTKRLRRMDSRYTRFSLWKLSLGGPQPRVEWPASARNQGQTIESHTRLYDCSLWYVQQAQHYTDEGAWREGGSEGRRNRMPLDKKDEDRDDWFEVLGLELDATGEMVNKGKSKWQPLDESSTLIYECIV